MAENGLLIFDISNASSPVLKGNYDNAAGAYDISGNYVYVAVGDGGLMILDINNPSSPVLKGSYDTAGFAYDVSVSDNYAYLADGRNGLVIVDISNPSSPIQIADYSKTIVVKTDIADFWTATDILVSGNYVYVATKE